MKRVTVKDLANKLGVSLSTINKALTGKSGISEDTRKKVLETADNMGYSVNKLAQSLARKPIKIGAIFPELWPEYYGYLQLGMNQALENLRDYNVNGIFKTFSHLYSREEVIESLLSFIQEKVNAVVVCPSFNTEYGMYLDELEDSGIPVIILGTNLPNGKRLSCIRVDANMSGKIAAEYMNWLVPPKKSIAIFIGNKDMNDHHEKVNGFMMEAAQCSFTVAGVYETLDEPEVAYYITKKLIKERSDLGGIYVATGNCMAVCKCLVDNGIEKEIKIISTDIFSDMKDYINDGVIQGVIFQDLVNQGRIAINTIYDYLANGIECKKDILVYPQLVIKSNFEAYLNGLELI